MSNSKLYPKTYKLSDGIISHLQNVYNKHKVDRVNNLLKEKTISYSNLKKFKSDIENADTNVKETLGGQTFLNWINKTLQSDRNSINITKKTKTDAGFENQYRKDHDVDYTRASKLDTRSNRIFEEIKYIIESTNRMISENVIDEIWYHGTNKPVKKFRFDLIGKNSERITNYHGYGIYFINNIDRAKKYGDIIIKVKIDTDSDIMEGAMTKEQLLKIFNQMKKENFELKPNDENYYNDPPFHDNHSVINDVVEFYDYLLRAYRSNLKSIRDVSEFLLRSGIDGMKVVNDVGDEILVMFNENKINIINQKKDLNENLNVVLKYKYSREDDYHTITAYDNNQKVGQISFEEMFSGYFYFEDEMTEDEYYELFPDDKFFIISHLTVDKNRRGEGIAQTLVQKALTKIKNFKHNRIYLNASPMGGDGLNVNDLANLYKKFGFEELLNQGNNIQMILKLN
jgi:GNAT superfamily N-acetyltransferase